VLQDEGFDWVRTSMAGGIGTSIRHRQRRFPYKVQRAKDHRAPIVYSSPQWELTDRFTPAPLLRSRRQPNRRHTVVVTRTFNKSFCDLLEVVAELHDLKACPSLCKASLSSPLVLSGHGHRSGLIHRSVTPLATAAQNTDPVRTSFPSPASCSRRFPSGGMQH